MQVVYFCCLLAQISLPAVISTGPIALFAVTGHNFYNRRGRSLSFGYKFAFSVIQQYHNPYHLSTWSNFDPYYDLVL